MDGMGILSTLISPQKFIILIPFRNGHPTAIQPLDASAEIPRLFFSIQALQPFSWRREGHFQGAASQNACPSKNCALVTSKYSVYYIRTCILVFNLNVDQSIYQVIQFVTFLSPISRSLKLWRGHVFTIPKRAPAAKTAVPAAIVAWSMFMTYKYYSPYHPCIVYLPTFTIKLHGWYGFYFIPTGFCTSAPGRSRSWVM